jgi:WD40 repeat protein
LRRQQSEELATIAYNLAGGETPGNYRLRADDLPLLLAREAAATYLYPPALPAPDPQLEKQIGAALDAVLATTPPRLVTYPVGGELPSLSSLALSPNGSVIATGHSDGSTRLWEYATGNLLRVLPSATGLISALEFSSDGSLLATIGDGGQVQMWHVDSAMRRKLHQGQYLHTSAMAWRPYTNDLAISNGQDPIVIELHDGSAHPLLDVAAEAMAYSPNGSQLAIAIAPHYPSPQESAKTQVYEPEQQAIWIVDADTGQLLHELADDAPTDFVTYTPNSRTLVAVEGNRLRAWDVASATLLYESQMLDFAKGWALTPDGDEIGILSRHAGISYYALKNGANVRNLAVDGDLLNWLAIHPTDGTLVSANIGGRPLLLNSETGAISFRFGAANARLVTTSLASRFFATCDQSIITVHDLGWERHERQLNDASAYITDLAMSPDGKRLAASDLSGNLLLWELDRAMLQWRAAVAEPGMTHIVFAPNGSIVIGDSAGHLRLVDAADGSIQKELAMGDAITALAVSSRNEATLVVGRSKGTGWRVNLDEWNESTQPIALPTIAGAERVYDQVAYSPDGSLLAVPRRMETGAEVTVELWDTSSYHHMRTIGLGAANNVKGIVFSPDGQQLAIGADSLHPITLWDVATGQLIQPLGDAKSSESTERLAYSPDGTQLFATGTNLVTTQYSLTPSPRLRTIAAGDELWDLDLSPNGHWVATAGGDHYVRLWDWQTGAQSDQAIEEAEPVHSVSFSPNDNAIVTGDDAGVVRLYDASGELERELQGHSAWVVDAIFSPDGAAIASAGADGTVRVWERASGRQIWSVEGLPHGMGAIAYSPDGSLLAGSADGGSNTTIYLWDAKSGKEVRQLPSHDNFVDTLAFSPDGKVLASGGWANTARLWDVASGDELATLAAHTSSISDLAFRPDGRQLATVASDCTLRLWDVASHLEVRRIDMPCAPPEGLTYSRDGRALLTAQIDGSVHAWLVDPDDPSLQAKMLRAAARVPRVTAEFTGEERQQFALDSFVGALPLSASANANLRPQPYVQSLIVQPRAAGSMTETLIALTNEKFLLSSVDQGESWRIVSRLPLTLTYHTLGIPARATDPLLVASEEGLYRLAGEALTPIHGDTLLGVSYSQTDVDELWAVRTMSVDKSEDGGATWGQAGNGLQPLSLFAPLLLTPPNNNPQVVVMEPLAEPKIGLWRGTGNGFWEELTEMPALPLGVAGTGGMAWDAGRRVLYLGGLDGELFASTALDAPNITSVTASVVEHFGAGVRPVVLAVGEGPALYLTLQTMYRPRLLRGTWDGSRWQWVELSLPLVPAG